MRTFAQALIVFSLVSLPAFAAESPETVGTSPAAKAAGKSCCHGKHCDLKKKKAPGGGEKHVCAGDCKASCGKHCKSGECAKGECGAKCADACGKSAT